MSKIKLVRGNVGTTFTVSLEDAEGPIDISQVDTTVYLKFKAEGATDLTDTITGEKLGGRRMEDGSVDTSYAVPGEKGRVQFAWTDAAINAPEGYYLGEIEIQFNDGAIIRTVYDLYHFSLRDAL